MKVIVIYHMFSTVIERDMRVQALCFIVSRIMKEMCLFRYFKKLIISEEKGYTI